MRGTCGTRRWSRPAARSRAPAPSCARICNSAISDLADVAVAVAPQHLARQRAGVGRVLDHDRAVDDDGGAFAGRILMRISVGRTVLEVLGIEDGHVGAVALPEQAAI